MGGYGGMGGRTVHDLEDSKVERVEQHGCSASDIIDEVFVKENSTMSCWQSQKRLPYIPLPS